jgi:D-amino-acid dehydrogenase
MALPGVIRNAPRMLLDKSGPLHIPSWYWFRAAPWLARFVASSRPTRVEYISRALASLLRPAIDGHREMLTEIHQAAMIRDDGQLFVYRDHAQLRKDHFAWELRKRNGYPVEVIDRHAIHALEPAIGDAYKVGVFLPDQAMISNPYRHCQVLAAALEARGVVILRERVAAIDVAQGSVVGVRGERAAHRADAVVICAGAWSEQLLRPLGFRLPLESQRGYHITLRDSGISITRPIVAADRKVFITPQETGLRVGGTVEFGGLNAPASVERINLLRADLSAVFPQVRTDGEQSQWMGHRPCFPDSMPVLGKCSRFPGLSVAFGHGHLGLTGAAVSGEIVARDLFGLAPKLDLEPFRIERFG